MAIETPPRARTRPLPLHRTLHLQALTPAHVAALRDRLSRSLRAAVAHALHTAFTGPDTDAGITDDLTSTTTSKGSDPLAGLTLRQQAQITGLVNVAIDAFDWTDEDVQGLAGAIAAARIASYTAAYDDVLSALGVDLTSYNPDESAADDSGEDDEDDQSDESDDAAVGIAGTYHSDLANQVVNQVSQMLPQILEGLGAGGEEEAALAVAGVGGALAQGLSGWAQNRGVWKADQIAATETATGANAGTNAAVQDFLNGNMEDILPPGLNPDDVYVAVLPEYSSTDFCADYAGNTYPITSYDLIPDFPAHPSCVHEKVILLAEGVSLDQLEEEEAIAEEEALAGLSSTETLAAEVQGQAEVAAATPEQPTGLPGGYMAMQPVSDAPALERVRVALRTAPATGVRPPHVIETNGLSSKAARQLALLNTARTPVEVQGLLADFFPHVTWDLIGPAVTFDEAAAAGATGAETALRAADVQLLKDAGGALIRQADLYPDAFDRVQWVGLSDTATGTAYLEEQTAGLGKPELEAAFRSHSPAAQFALTDGTGSGFLLNANFFKDPERLDRALAVSRASGYFHAGAADAGYVITHEFGHALQEWLASDAVDSATRAEYARVLRGGEQYVLREGELGPSVISRYATSSPSELWAESYTLRDYGTLTPGLRALDQLEYVQQQRTLLDAAVGEAQAARTAAAAEAARAAEEAAAGRALERAAQTPPRGPPDTSLFHLLLTEPVETAEETAAATEEALAWDRARRRAELALTTDKRAIGHVVSLEGLSEPALRRMAALTQLDSRDAIVAWLRREFPSVEWLLPAGDATHLVDVQSLKDMAAALVREADLFPDVFARLRIVGFSGEPAVDSLFAAHIAHMNYPTTDLPDGWFGATVPVYASPAAEAAGRELEESGTLLMFNPHWLVSEVELAPDGSVRRMVYDAVRARTREMAAARSSGWTIPAATDLGKTVTHEFGHAIEDYLTTPGLASDALRQEYEDAQVLARERYIARRLEATGGELVGVLPAPPPPGGLVMSEYARTNPREMWAETFAAREYGGWSAREIAALRDFDYARAQDHILAQLEHVTPREETRAAAEAIQAEGTPGLRLLRTEREEAEAPVAETPEIRALRDTLAAAQDAERTAYDVAADAAARSKTGAVPAKVRKAWRQAQYDREAAQASLDQALGGRGAIVHLENFEFMPGGQVPDHIYQVQDRLAAFFPGRADIPLTADEIAGLVGAPENAYVRVTAIDNKSLFFDMRGVAPGMEPRWDPLRTQIARQPGQSWEAHRVLRLSGSKANPTLAMSNMSFFVSRSAQGLGIGTHVFADEVGSLADLGVKKIVTSAGGPPGMNGYYTWARLGYTGKLSAVDMAALRDAVAAGDLPKAFAKYTRVEQVMHTPEGAAWWKANAKEGFEGTFDLKAGSKSREVLAEYLRAKGGPELLARADRLAPPARLVLPTPTVLPAVESIEPGPAAEVARTPLSADLPPARELWAEEETNALLWVTEDERYDQLNAAGTGRKLPLSKTAGGRLAARLKGNTDWTALQKRVKQIGLVDAKQATSAAKVANAILDAWHTPYLAEEGERTLAYALQQAVRDQFGLSASTSITASAEDLARADAVLGDVQPGLRAFMQAMYDETQAWLVAHDVGDAEGEITVYRGMRWRAETARPLPEGIRWDGVPQRASLRMQPMSSFSVSAETAARYTRYFSGEADPQYKTIIATRVPRERVLSTRFTGLGYPGQGETLILGGEGEAQAISVSAEAIEADRSVRMALNYDRVVEAFGSTSTSEETATREAATLHLLRTEEEGATAAPYAPLSTALPDAAELKRLADQQDALFGGYQGGSAANRILYDSAVSQLTTALADDTGWATLVTASGAKDERDLAGKLLKTWATGGSSPLIVAMQQAVRDEFGLAEQGAAFSYTKSQLAKAAASVYGSEEGQTALRAFVRAMYEQTQDYLSAHGVEEVVLYRGMTFPAGKGPEGLLFDKAVQRAEIALNPISSFSGDLATARRFAQDMSSTTKAKDAAVLAVRVPRERVLSVAMAGIGTRDEVEYTVLGGRDTALVYGEKTINTLGQHSFIDATFDRFADAAAAAATAATGGAGAASALLEPLAFNVRLPGLSARDLAELSDRAKGRLVILEAAQTPKSVLTWLHDVYSSYSIDIPASAKALATYNLDALKTLAATLVRTDDQYQGLRSIFALRYVGTSDAADAKKYLRDLGVLTGKGADARIADGWLGSGFRFADVPSEHVAAGRGSGIILNTRVLQDPAYLEQVLREGVASGLYPPVAEQAGLDYLLDHQMGHVLGNWIADTPSTYTGAVRAEVRSAYQALLADAPDYLAGTGGLPLTALSRTASAGGAEELWAEAYAILRNAPEGDPLRALPFVERERAILAAARDEHVLLPAEAALRAAQQQAQAEAVTIRSASDLHDVRAGWKPLSDAQVAEARSLEIAAPSTEASDLGPVSRGVADGRAYRLQVYQGEETGDRVAAHVKGAEQLIAKLGLADGYVPLQVATRDLGGTRGTEQLLISPWVDGTSAAAIAASVASGAEGAADLARWQRADVLSADQRTRHVVADYLLNVGSRDPADLLLVGAAGSGDQRIVERGVTEHVWSDHARFTPAQARLLFDPTLTSLSDDAAALARLAQETHLAPETLAWLRRDVLAPTKRDQLVSIVRRSAPATNEALEVDLGRRADMWAVAAFETRLDVLQTLVDVADREGVEAATLERLARITAEPRWSAQIEQRAHALTDALLGRTPAAHDTWQSVAEVDARAAARAATETAALPDLTATGMEAESQRWEREVFGPDSRMGAARADAARADLHARLAARLADNADWQHLLRSGFFRQAYGESAAVAVRELSVATPEQAHLVMLRQTWAGSSAGDALAVSLQMAAEAEFGLSADMGWMAGAYKMQAYAQYGQYEPGLRAFLRAMYEETQADLAARGMDEVTLYRGLNWAKSSPYLPDGVLWDASQPRVVDAALQPLSSFSADPKTSLLFAAGGDYHQLLTIRVPARDVLSFSRTGIGMSLESEFVVLGGTHEAVALSWEGEWQVAHAAYAESGATARAAERDVLRLVEQGAHAPLSVSVSRAEEAIAAPVTAAPAVSAELAATAAHEPPGVGVSGAFPTSYEDLTARMQLAAGPTGSQEGQWFADKVTGERYYVKPALDPAHAYNEVGGMTAYRVLAGAEVGTEIPDVRVLKDAAGQRYIVSREVPSLTRHDAQWWASDAAAPTAARADAERLWAYDAILAHWDVIGVGQGWDNLLIDDATGHAVRIEAGGAMAYGGLGGVKPTWKVGGDFSEPWRMRGLERDGITPAAGRGEYYDRVIFGGITNGEAADLLEAAGAQVSAHLDELAAAWKSEGMPAAQVKRNVAVLKDRVARLPEIEAELRGSSAGGAGEAEAGGGGLKLLRVEDDTLTHLTAAGMDAEYTRWRDEVFAPAMQRSESEAQAAFRAKVTQLTDALADNADWQQLVASDRVFAALGETAATTAAQGYTREQAVAGLLVRAWSDASAGNALTVALQQAADAEFARNADVSHFAAALREQATAEYGPYTDGLRAFLRAVYDDTQAELAARGVTEVTLYRGLMWWDETAPGLPRGIAWDGTHATHLDVALQPLSSFTSDPRAALGFSQWAYPQGYHQVLVTVVPARDVLSFSATGIGTAFESEFVVLGGAHEAFAVSWQGDLRAILDAATGGAADPRVHLEIWRMVEDAADATRFGEDVGAELAGRGAAAVASTPGLKLLTTEEAAADDAARAAGRLHIDTPATPPANITELTQWVREQVGALPTLASATRLAEDGVTPLALGAGVQTHEDAVVLGRVIREYLHESDLAWERDALQARLDILATPTRIPGTDIVPLTALTDEQRAWVNGDRSVFHGIGYHEAEDRYRAAQQDLVNRMLRAVYGADGIGGVSLDVVTGEARADARVAEAAQAAVQELPRQWLEASNADGPLSFWRDLSHSGSGYYETQYETDTGTGRIVARYRRGTTDAELQTTVMHEFGHRMEDVSPLIATLERTYYEARTAGESYVDLTNGIANKTKLDAWGDQYLGRIPVPTRTISSADAGLLLGIDPTQVTYDERELQSYELLSVGLETLLGDAADVALFVRDPDFHAFVLGVLFGARTPVTAAAETEAETEGARGGLHLLTFEEAQREAATVTVTADEAALATLSDLTEHWFTATDEDMDTAVIPAEVAQTFGAPAHGTMEISAVYGPEQNAFTEAPQAIEAVVSDRAQTYTLDWLIAPGDTSWNPRGSVPEDLDLHIRLMGGTVEPGDPAAREAALAAFDRAVAAFEDSGVEAFALPTYDATAAASVSSAEQDDFAPILHEYLGTQSGDVLDVHAYLYGGREGAGAGEGEDIVLGNVAESGGGLKLLRTDEEPQLPPEPFDFSQSQLAADMVADEHLSPLGADGSDVFLDRLITERGWAGLPEMGSPAALADRINQGGIEVWRGFSSPQVQQQFLSGAYYAGNGIYGDGTYVATEEAFAQLYSLAGPPLHMVISPDAQVIAYDTLRTLWQQRMDGLLTQMGAAMRAGDEATWNVLRAEREVTRDIGRYAVLQGYDVITTTDRQAVVLNRERLLVDEAQAAGKASGSDGGLRLLQTGEEEPQPTPTVAAVSADAVSPANLPLPVTDTALVQYIRDQLATLPSLTAPDGTVIPAGVTKHEDAIALGAAVRDYVHTAHPDVYAAAQEAYTINTTLQWRTDAQIAWMAGEPDALAAHGGIRWEDALTTYRSTLRQTVADTLAQVRPLAAVGDEERGVSALDLALTDQSPHYDQHAADAVAEMAGVLPRDWVQASNDLGPLTVMHSVIGGYYSPDPWSGTDYIGLAYGTPRLDATLNARAIHELGHRMEDAIPQLGALEGAFYDYRTAGESFVPLTNGIPNQTKLDNWFDQYLGREPIPNTRQSGALAGRTPEAVSYELLTVGLQTLWDEDAPVEAFLADPEYLAFVLGLLFGVYWQAPGASIP